MWLKNLCDILPFKRKKSLQVAFHCYLIFQKQILEMLSSQTNFLPLHCFEELKQKKKKKKKKGVLMLFGEIKLISEEELCTAQNVILQSKMSTVQATVTVKITQP